ncbi:hypothetical protein F3Y22_tig00111584pilonHSYRG00191 [Hibiscus syriacus]|uniref:SAP domain-containing protein n=1 Tax=Hibiscus syriacus TaxID=106335 RepID=A0A6A2YIQ0_HIBSY|nr:hypothetical protein F3Y22_tig00111584pilonHSYRG00191 [Hibiscus syriacus]
MSSKFEILHNRPIDKWKVVELKEELKRRHLTTRGLKKDLVKRLDAAVRAERAEAANEADDSFHNDNSEPVVEKATPTIADKVKEVVDHDGLKLKGDNTDSAAAPGHGVVDQRDVLVEPEHLQSSKLKEDANSNMHTECQDPEPPVENEGTKLNERDEKNDSVSTNSMSVTEKNGQNNNKTDYDVKIRVDFVIPETVELDSSNGSGHGVAEERDMVVEDEPVIQATEVKTSIPEVPLNGQNLHSSMELELECRDPMLRVENEGLKAQLENEEDMHGSSAMNNQVSEISPISGFQVKPDSISTDPMSITEKTELKYNIVDDNVKSEMVEPYSSNGSGHGVVEGRDILVEDETFIQATEVKTMIPEVPLIVQNLQSSKQEENMNSNMEMECQDPMPQVENKGPKAQLEDDIHGSSSMNNQVSEISLISGCQVKTDHMSITKKTELKDNIVDDNVKSEMEEPYSSNVSGQGVVEERDMVEDEPVIQAIDERDMLFEDEPVIQATEVKTMILQVPLMQSSRHEENVNSNMQIECQDPMPRVENEGPKVQLENEDEMHDSYALNNQVSEISPISGLQVKSDSISTGPVLNTQKTVLKDNIVDDNVKSEMVEPCSFNGLGHGVVEVRDVLVEDEPVIQAIEVETMIPEVSLIGHRFQISKLQENVNSNMQMEGQDPMPQVENEGPKALLENEEDMYGSSAMNNQVYEINPISGFQVKSDSISTDPIPITEESVLKDNIVNNNVKSEMVEPYSSNGSGHGVVEERGMLVEAKPVIQALEVDTMIPEVPLIGQHLQSSKQEENVNSNMQIESQDRKLEAESDDPVAQPGDEDHEDDMHEKVKDVVDHGGSEIEKGSGLKFKEDITDCEAASGDVVNESDMLEEDKPVVTKVPPVVEHLQSSKQEENVNSNTAEMECQDGKPQVVTEVPLIEEHLQSSKPEENVNSNNQMECQDGKSQVENECLKVEVETSDPKSRLENGDDMHDSSSLNNQGPEINPVSGFQVKSDSISNDSMSINETIELQDNIIDENVKLSQDDKLEMVEPCSSSNVVPNNDESQPKDDDGQPLRNMASVDETDENNDTTTDMNYKDDSEEMGSSEKLNLDRSSSDDSMEYLPETMQIEEDSVENEALIIKELENHILVAGDGSSNEKKDIFDENKSHSSFPSAKRKLQDEEAIENNEPPKRHKCNSDSLQVSELQATNLTPTQSNLSSSDSADSEDTPTPKEQDGKFSLLNQMCNSDSLQVSELQDTNLTPTQSNLSSSDSADSEDTPTPKEQDVPPSKKPPTTSLRVDNFIRPFTLKAVEQLLGKTGTVTSFWMDHIKTHCYVTYSSVEEAIETRNALYNLRWPTNGGRLLVAEFVDPHEVKALTSQPQPSAHQHISPSSAKLLLVPPPSPPSEGPDSPMVTLDDLFWKTKATPKIYYLPLSEEQVAAKQATRERNNW